MKISEKKPTRKFLVGEQNQLTITDCGAIILEPDEMVTLIDSEGSEFDITKKNWGYYATPSINKRLKHNGFKTALVVNKAGDTYIMLVKENHRNIFSEYLSGEGSKVVCWLDEDLSISTIEESMK